MPLTEPQKVAIKRHLGFHSAPQPRFPLVEGFFAVDDILSSLGVDAIAEVTAILTRLNDLETSLDTAKNRFKASRVGSIGLNGQEADQLWREIRRWRHELATVTGVPMRRVAAGLAGAVVVNNALEISATSMGLVTASIKKTAPWPKSRAMRVGCDLGT